MTGLHVFKPHQHEEGGYMLEWQADLAKNKLQSVDDPFVIMQSGWTQRYHVIREFAVDKWLKQGFKRV